MSENYGKMLDMLDLALMMQEQAGGVTLDEITEHFGVSRRTAERMRNALANYFNVAFSETVGDDRKKRFKLDSNPLRSLISVSFTKEELAACETALALMEQHSLDEKRQELAHMFQKLKAIGKPKTSLEIDVEDLLKAEGFALRPGPKLQINQEILNNLRHALLSFHVVRIEYHNKYSGKTSWNTLVPLGILYGERNHYLVAKHADGYKEQPSHFILSNIKWVHVLDDTFEEDSDFSLTKHTLNSFGSFQEAPFEVEWLFSPNVAGEAAQYLFHPSQTITHNDDGSLTVKFKAGGRREMAWHLYTWGDDVKVIEPLNFWDKL